MQKVFFIADTHFGDSGVIAYENRPFPSADDMDDVLVKNWNDTVSESDKIFVVGDLSFHGKEKTIEICRRLNGEKFLVMGNHDTENEQFYYECGFSGVSRYPIIYGGFWIISHEPLYVSRNAPYANIFGHVHGNPIYRDVSERSFCVSAERINYTPIEFTEIQERIKENIL
ncbi:MAG: metallophosphoesterase [Ruminococcus flavefaciens]|nr:metallophosphoesterase [Ruminococcus flavefaciens]MCM1231200.1 metallophosphoesterase [Ruminococcus flavefaciens]